MKYIVKKSWFAAEEGEILTKETQVPFCLVNSDDVQVVVEYNVQDALDQGFIEPYEEKPKMLELLEEVSLAIGDLYKVMDKYRSYLNDFSKSFADNEVSDE